MLEHLQRIARRKLTGLWLLVAALLFVQILPLHFHKHAPGHEPTIVHHHNVMTYLNDGGDELDDTQVQTINLDLHSLSDVIDVDMPVLLLTLVMLLTLVACYRCLAIRRTEAALLSFPPGSYKLPPLRAPPLH